MSDTREVEIPHDEYVRARQIIATAMNENNAELLFDAVTTAREILAPYVIEPEVSDEELADIEAKLRARP